ncbi:hypothetical protein LZD49_11815 [Dyadobacter sp. CY261]|uniref:hypothetical protein n=1 Tax=Dyadobacter sp. CY261 TaxID=2907203 RepID=UPI001F434587|nr:hypothetical protein [Dyadobacter sp. CY261]MCF0071158.1 hypothetical protein [Dyadobacter sp. CY261]
MRKTKTLKTNYALPGQPMAGEEAKRMVEEAQQGKFHSMDDLKRKIAEWKLKFARQLSAISPSKALRTFTCMV